MAVRERKTVFNVNWIKDLDAEAWLKKGSGESVAYCSICSCEIDISKNGISAIKKHMNTSKHTVSFFF